VVVVESEHLGVRPDVRRVEADVDGEVADEADVPLGRVFGEVVPLAVKAPLDERVVADVRGQFVPVSLHGRRLACPDVVRPVHPASPVELGFQRGKQRVVVQPAGLALAELGERLLLCLARTLVEARVRVPEPPRLELGHAVVLDVLVREILGRLDIVFGEIAPLDEVAEVDEQRVPGERRR